ncbi:MAG: hypothetical protein JW837_19055 [Sedimentisphaerales bacterium]|nr:hypothetical protein [Sedimentisphaerales bacterium]
MAMAKRSQSNPWMPATIVFVFLFIVAAVVAVVFYLDMEKKAKTIDELQTQQQDVINSRQWSNRANLIGTVPSNNNIVGILLEHIDQMTQLILGAPVEEKSADIKLQNVNNRINEFMTTAASQYPDIGSVDVKTIGLVGTLGRIKNILDSAVVNMVAMQEQIEETRKRLVQTEQISNDKVQELQVEKENLAADVNEVLKNYDELKALMQKSTEDQVQLLWEDLKKARERAEELNTQLLKTQAEYKLASEMLRDTREQLAKFTGQPDKEPQIREPDGQIILLDEASRIVHLDIGSKNKVYPGLTFGVYDRNVPIPSDGKSKAEVIVFNVDENISVARIVTSDIRNPILRGDIVANLVWSKDQTNLFVVAGDFDLDFDELNDREAERKISGLIDVWGGKVQEEVTINTDFIVLGTPPQVLPRPTYDQIAIDSLAMEKYEKSLQKLERYKKVKEQSEKLQIPLLSYERFLYLIGYKNQASRPGAFSD